MPVYALYAVWFGASGLSEAQISALFVIWSVVGLVVEVPSGALADRFSRRGAVVAAGLGQAVGYAVWALWPTFAGFALGFALWAIGGSLDSGAREALLYDALAAAGAQARYARLIGATTAAGLLAEVPAAGLATLLWSVGGFTAVAWASVGTCLLAAVVATRLPETRPDPGSGPDGSTDRSTDGSTDGRTDDDESGYRAALRAGIAEAAARPAVRALLVPVAVLAGVDAVEEYFPLLAADWSVPTGFVPLAVVATSVAGAAGAALAGRVAGWSRWRLAAVVAGAGAALAVAAALAVPAGMVLVAAFYGAYRMVLVVLQARLQDRIGGPARATVTSVAGLATEVVGIGVFAAWAVGGVWPVVVAALAVAALLPRLLRGDGRG